MATIASPQPRGSAWRPRFLAIALIVLVVGLTAAFGLRSAAGAPAALPSGWRLTAAAAGPIDATVDAPGTVEARASAELRFAQEGSVSAVLVKVGDTIAAGAPLAEVDSADLRLRLAQARTDLEQARADEAQARQAATPEQIAAAQARVAQAQGQLRQAQGRVTPADLAAAGSRIAQAQAKLDRLQAGPASDEQTRSVESVRRAQIGLDQARSDLSGAKERARLDVEAKANALRNAQDEYSRIYWQNRNVEKYAKLPQEQKDREAQALRAVSDAQTALDQAGLAYEQARQNEISTLQSRESELASAQADAAKVGRGALPEELADARAELERAQAAYAQLVGANRQGELAALGAGVAAAQADLDKLAADPAQSAITKAQAGVARAELSVQQAELALGRATLRAPFAATIVRVAMRVGESASQGAIIALADLSALQVSADVDELDVARLRAGQAAQVSLDALPEAALSGEVSEIAPAALRNSNGSNTYRVVVTLGPAQATVRPGMSAALRVVIAHKENAVLVPRSALVSEGGVTYVRVPDSAPPAEAGAPAYARRTVTVGLSSGEFSEILSGLQAGEQVYIQDAVAP